MQLPQNTHTHFSLSHSHFPCHVLIFSSRQCYTEYETTTHLPTHTLDTCFWEMWMNVSQKRPWRHSIQYGLVLQWWVTQLCVLVCARGCVCLHNQGQASACGCRELHKSHSESIRKHKCEKANSSRCPGTRFNVGLTTDTPHPHHPTTCAHTLTHTSRLKARHKHSEFGCGCDVTDNFAWK